MALDIVRPKHPIQSPLISHPQCTRQSSIPLGQVSRAISLTADPFRRCEGVISALFGLWCSVLANILMEGRTTALPHPSTW